MGEDIATVTLKQVADSVPFGFCGRKVATLDDGTFHHLSPFFSLRELRKRCDLLWIPFASYADTIGDCTILHDALVNCSHCRWLPKIRGNH